MNGVVVWCDGVMVCGVWSVVVVLCCAVLFFEVLYRAVLCAVLCCAVVDCIGCGGVRERVGLGWLEWGGVEGVGGGGVGWGGADRDGVG